MKKPLRVLIVENQAFYRDGLVELLGTDPQLEVAGTTGSGRQAVALAASLRPDLVIMDLVLETRTAGLEAISAIRAQQKDAKILVLTNHDDEEYVLKALDSGAKGYLIKDDCSNEEILRALRGIADGSRPAPYHPCVTAYLLERLKREKALKEIDALSDREAGVLKLMAEGLSNEQIAERLGLSYNSVRTYTSEILSKLRVRNRVQAIRLAQQLRLIPGPSGD
ncbi:MAG TPA: response regulator transcription factor [Thermoanaerobaculia bacterium]|nr:response regulator transcription factor [Thermoanaerobaculia bacterium]